MQMRDPFDSVYLLYLSVPASSTRKHFQLLLCATKRFHQNVYVVVAVGRTACFEVGYFFTLADAKQSHPDCQDPDPRKKNISQDSGQVCFVHVATVVLM